jgi:hypothetical protein
LGSRRPEEVCSIRFEKIARGVRGNTLPSTVLAIA